MPVAFTVEVSLPGRTYNLLPSLEFSRGHSFLGVTVRKGPDEVVLTKPAAGFFDVETWQEIGQDSFSISSEFGALAGGPGNRRRMLVDVSALLGELAAGTYEVQFDYQVRASVTLRTAWQPLRIVSGAPGPAANFYRAYHQWLVSPGFFTAPLAIDGLESLDVFAPERAVLRACWVEPPAAIVRALGQRYPELVLFNETLRAKLKAN